MSSKGLSPAQLMSCSDADFDNNINSMAVKNLSAAEKKKQKMAEHEEDLMGLISSLQKEMAKEQGNFDSLSGALQGLKDRNSRQYKTISRDMVASQSRLTTLMNRSMKCFSQQNLQQNSQGSQLQRRNSSKTATSPNSSPSKSSNVQRSRSMHSTCQPDGDKSTPAPTSQPSSTTPTPAAAVVYRGGVNRSLSNRVEVRPASVGSVNGVLSNSRATPAAGNRVSLGFVPGVALSPSLSSLNILPQPRVMGCAGLNEQQKLRSRSQILITPSPASSQPVQSSSPTPPPNAFSSPPLTHASSQPMLDASSSHGQGSADSPPGLPSVRQLAQTFGAKVDTDQSKPASNYRPVIRAQSMATSDASRRPNLMAQSSASPKVNGVPSLTAGGRVQGQYVKRNAATKAPGITTTPATSATNGQTEIEKAHSRLRTPRDINVLPDKPSTPASTTSPRVQNGDREVSYFTTNLDRKKSSSSIVLGQKSDFDDDVDSASSAFGRSSSPSQGMQLSPLRKAQSREELYAIESRARVQKGALLKEIGGKKTDSAEEDAYNAMPVSGQWGLKGVSLLAQRLQKGKMFLPFMASVIGSFFSL